MKGEYSYSMELIIKIIAIIIGISLLATLRHSRPGQIFLFAIYVIIICSTFGGFIPFAGLIIKLAKFVIVALIIWFGARMIFN